MKPKVYISIPVYRYIEENTRQNITDIVLSAKNWEALTIENLYGMSQIDKARHIIAERFLKSNADYLFMIDSDIQCESALPIDLLIDDNKDIIGGLYVFKSFPYLPALRRLDATKDWTYLNKLPEPFEVKYLSGGFMLIKRKVVKACFDYFKYPFIPIAKGNDYLSEDWSFCENAREIYFKIWAEPRIKLYHWGQYPFTMEDYLKIKDMKPIKTEGYKNG